MHGECARRAGYYMECGITENEQPEPPNENSESKTGLSKRSKHVTFSYKDRSAFKIFCEGHRPFKLIKQIKEKYESNTEDLVKF